MLSQKHLTQECYVSMDITASSCVNVGNQILSKMTGSSVHDFTPRRREQCVLMREKDHPGSKNQMGKIDPNFYFKEWSLF